MEQLGAEVINLNDFRKKQGTKKNQETYVTYLRSLKDNQLEFEMNYVLVTGEKDKGVLLMKEMARRASDSPIKDKINAMATKLENRLP